MRSIYVLPIRLSLLAATLLTIASLTACSSHPDPIVDTQGVNMTVYEQDLAECKSYSEQIDPSQGMAKGAAGGAVTGGAIGAIGSGGIGKGAGIGAILGMAGSGSKAATDKEEVVKRCLRYRGYKVLN
ncbi:MAG: glycine zipper family protein [Gammaproteobacteria bacterium]|nr:glycine zipper family protein [Gammaproteobacteria bacterium]MCP4089036.1 glycine zipper family protein [Gammaproteobacteria bacterium]MCP4278064.1 glycine zipper family protein [Gammaproteobacteria bacterium]MCP4833040.1 glycine zipper family protein [Gammaproteobacteria bacterium]MCP4929005.1 glycine zipper family protein [Gammaproteobacteria bacterium]